MDKKITYDDLILMFGNQFIPKDIDIKILMKHFDIGVNRIIGERSIDKIKKVLLNSIEIARNEQNKEKGGVIDSPLHRYKKEPEKVKNTEHKSNSKKHSSQIKTSKSQLEDKYDLKSIKTGIVSERLKKRTNSQKDRKNEQKTKKISSLRENGLLPSVEELKVLSGDSLVRDIDTDSINDVQREIAIREFQTKDENRSIRWGYEFKKDREGKNQEIHHPSYIFHSDLWQFEEAREKTIQNRCDILQHVVLDMVANNINVVMLENEEEPFFVVEGIGLLHSKESLKDRVKIDKLIQLMVISCEAWQIALKKPEALLKGRDTKGIPSKHTIDMTSIVPLSTIKEKMVQLDNEFEIQYLQPENTIKKAIRVIEKHRKELIWSCGASSISFLRNAIIKHKRLLDNCINELNVVIIGSNKAFHPIKLKFNNSESFEIEELLQDYCKKHTILSDKSIKNILGSIPTIFSSSSDPERVNEMACIANSISQRIGYSSSELFFDPGYVEGNPSKMIPISKMDIVLPPSIEEVQQKFMRKGFKLD